MSARQAARLWFAEFGAAEALCEAARRVREARFDPVDALTPSPVEALDEALGLRPSSIRLPMLLGGLGVAALLFAVEAWSASAAYPINSGARPLFSWQVFLLAPLEVGALAAAVAGFIALLTLCGLPRLNHPVFDWDGSERATVDRYMLAIAAPDGDSEAERLRAVLAEAGALSVGSGAS